MTPSCGCRCCRLWMEATRRATFHQRRWRVRGWSSMEVIGKRKLGGRGGETGRLGHRESRFLPNLLTVGVDVMLISCVLWDSLRTPTWLISSLRKENEEENVLPKQRPPVDETYGISCFGKNISAGSTSTVYQAVYTLCSEFSHAGQWWKLNWTERSRKWKD